MDNLRPLLYFILGLSILFQVWFEISKANPCSVWTDTPSNCSPPEYQRDYVEYNN